MRFVKIGNVTLSYRVDGSVAAPPLVFSNSLGTDYRIWDEVVDELAGEFRCIRYDKRGHGLSSVPLAPYSMADHATDLAGLLDSLGVSRAVVCGLSIGGMIAQQFAADHPESVQKLILCDTAHLIGPKEIWDARIAQVRDTGIAPMSAGVMERWFGESYHAEHADQLAGWTRMLESVPVEGYVGSCAALRDADLSASSAEISAPTLCICGSEDRATTPDLVKSLAELIPNAEFQLIEGAGHLPCVEMPARIAKLIREFAGHSAQ